MGNNNLVIQIISDYAWLSLNVLILGKDYVTRVQAIQQACSIWEEKKNSYIEGSRTGNILTINIVELYN